MVPHLFISSVSGNGKLKFFGMNELGEVYSSFLHHAICIPEVQFSRLATMLCGILSRKIFTIAISKCRTVDGC